MRFFVQQPDARMLFKDDAKLTAIPVRGVEIDGAVVKQEDGIGSAVDGINVGCKGRRRYLTEVHVGAPLLGDGTGRRQQKKEGKHTNPGGGRRHIRMGIYRLF